MLFLMWPQVSFSTLVSVAASAQKSGICEASTSCDWLPSLMYMECLRPPPGRSASSGR